ncbi:MAG: hypothetical protein ND807_05100 [Vicinamibacterales bacterium]|nr:hypothetical protein [Vicinamibacterales bacterium]
MRWYAAVALAAGGALVSAQQLPSEPQRQFGTSITGAFEGWFVDSAGTRSFLVGYLNRNATQALDVPIGPNNRIEPGGPDMGQPTHFLPGRQWGMFTVTVPKDFTTPTQRLTWTIVANGQSTSIPLRLHPDYNVSPFADVAVKNTPPVLRFEEQGPDLQGPTALLSTAVTRTVSVSTPLDLPLWASDDARFASGTMALPRNPPPPVELSWSKYRGPGVVTFDKDHPKVEVLAGGTVDAPFRGKSVTTARFGQPGEYVLHLTANDYSGTGGSGEVCCWTTAMVKVSVRP